MSSATASAAPAATSKGVSKIQKKDKESHTELEKRVDAILQELGNPPATAAPTDGAGAASHLREGLAKVHFSRATEVDVDKASGRKAILLYVPFPLLHDVRRIQKVLVDELEKKIAGSNVIIIANRTRVPAAVWARGKEFSGVRPRSRTLRAVQEALLDDIAYPTEIVGKRLRVKADGKRLLRVHLNPKDMMTAEGKLDAFTSVYKSLTNKDVAFEFPTTH